MHLVTSPLGQLSAMVVSKSCNGVPSLHNLQAYKIINQELTVTTTFRWDHTLRPDCSFLGTYVCDQIQTRREEASVPLAAYNLKN